MFSKFVPRDGGPVLLMQCFFFEKITGVTV